MPKKGYTYITTNAEKPEIFDLIVLRASREPAIRDKNHTVLYTGATSTLKDRIDRHRTKKYKNAFSARYNFQDGGSEMPCTPETMDKGRKYRRSLAKKDLSEVLCFKAERFRRGSSSPCVIVNLKR